MYYIFIIILKACSSSRLSAAIYSLFKCCVSLGVTPLRWNESIIFPIPKKSSSRHIQDYRPIALTNIFRRLFESILLKFIRSKLSMFFDLCPNQTGYSTITHAIVSNEIACSGSSLQFHVFLDLRKAYDSVPMVMLVNKLINRNIPSGIVSLLISLFTSCTTRILVNGELTNKIQLSRGLMQGAILAPFLFNIFIDDLASSLSSNWPNDPFPHSLFFADDIKLNHSSLEYLQDMPDICYRWSLDNGMEFNVLKSAFHNCPLLDNSNSTLSLGYSLLPGVDSYTYLGFPHTFKCINWKEHLKAASLKAHKLLQSLSDYQYLWNPGVKLTIFRTFIWPSMEHSACLVMYWMRNWYKTSEIKEYNSVITDGLFWVSNSRKFNITCAIFGIPPSLLRLFCLACKLRKHIHLMNPSNPLSSAFSKINIRNNQFLTNSFGYRIINYNIFQHRLFHLEPPQIT